MWCKKKIPKISRKIQLCASQREPSIQCTKSAASFAQSASLADQFAAKYSQIVKPELPMFSLRSSFKMLNRLSYFDLKIPWELRSLQQFLGHSKIELKTKNSTFAWQNTTLISWTESWKKIFNEIECAIKINLPFGFDFSDIVETQDYLCFYFAINKSLYQLFLPLGNGEILSKRKIKYQQRPFRTTCTSSSEQRTKFFSINKVPTIFLSPKRCTSWFPRDLKFHNLSMNIH